MKLWLLWVCLLVATSLVLFACTKGVEEPTGLEDKTWLLESYGEHDSLQEVLANTGVTAIFESAEGRVHGSAGCNSYSGDYQVSKNELSIPLIANTEMYCLEPEGVMEQETQYLKILQIAESYEVSDGMLRITAGSQVLVFSAEE
ncbi:META domain-containing protein [Chloroflexota bacterium]